MATNGQKSSDKTSDEFYEFVCSPCTADNKKQEGIKFCLQCNEYFCSKCLAEHNRFAVLKRHTLKDAAEMAGKEKQLQGAAFVPLEGCAIHYGNAVDTFCGNHNVLCCATCVSLGHRSCDDITYIVDAATGVSNSQEYKTIKSKMRKVQSHLEQVKKMRQDDCNRFDIEKNTCLAKVEDFRIKIDQMVKEAKDKIRTTHGERCEAVIVEIKAIEQMVSTLEDNIDQLKKANISNEPQVFVYTKTGVKNENDAEVLLQKLTTNSRQEPLNFEINKTIDDALMGATSLGKFQQAETGNQLYSIKFRGSYNVKTDDDLKSCDITGSCILSDGTLMITDWNNDRLKRADQSFKVITDTYEFPTQSCPYGVCAIDTGHVAVALTNKKKIQFMSINDQMKPETSFDIRQRCWGLYYIGGELLVSCDRPGQVHTYTTSGELLRTFQTDGTGLQMFSIPFHIAVSADGKKIHISDKDNGVLTLDRLGKKISQFSDAELRDTRCVQVDAGGQLFVCGRDSGTIIQISPEGETLGRKVVGDWPKSLCFHPKKSTLVVTMMSNKIEVFDLTKNNII